MTTIDLMYNPYTRKKKVLKNGVLEPSSVVSKLCGAEGTELSEWAEKFLSSAICQYNDSLTVNFSGIRRDYEFLQDAKEKLIDYSKDIILEEAKIVEPENRLEELKKLFAKMQEKTPFSSLKSEEVKRLFKKATDSEFEMAVVATMSSGKSTLINSILGMELLPARNEATTANIARIHDIDEADHFTAESFDKDGNKLGSADPLTPEEMEKLNNIDGEKPASIIEIYGDIPGIESKNIRLILSDTPGTNNSRTTEHHKHTMDLLNADYKPMVIYLLDSTNLEANDDSVLLGEVAHLVKSGDRQSRDRFIFVMSKADVFDNEKGSGDDSVSKKIDDVKRYLTERHEIENPRVFPTAARLAKIIRQDKNHDPKLTKKERRSLIGESGIEAFIEDEGMHFTDYADFLSPSTFEELDRRIEKAKSSNNNEELALLYSGVPSIELAISEYLTKYALPAKITEGVYSFKDKIEALNIEANAKEELAGNEQKIKEMQQNLKDLKSVLDKGDKAREVRQQIKDLSVGDKVDKELAKASSKLLSTFSTEVDRMKRQKVCAEEARSNIATLKSIISKIEAAYKSSVEKSLDSVLRSQVEKCVNNYKKYVEDLIGSVSYKMSAAAILGDKATISVDEAIDIYQEEYHYRKKQSGFWGAFKRFISLGNWGYEDVYGKSDFVDFDKYIDNKLFPKIEEFINENCKIAKNSAKEKERDFKQFYLNKLSELDEIIKQKLAEQEEILKDKEKMEEMIEKNRNNLVWLDSFKKQLDGILNI